MRLGELPERARMGWLESLDLISLEGGIYLLEARDAEGCHPVTDDAGKVLRLRSVEHAREVLQEVAAVPFFLVHSEVHDQMCGMPPAASEPLRVPISLVSS